MLHVHPQRGLEGWDIVPVYEDPREALLRRVQHRFPAHPVLMNIIKEYRKSGHLLDHHWALLKQVDVEQRTPSLHPEFEKKVVVWLRDLGLTLKDVEDLAIRRKGERLLAEQQTAVPRVLVVRKPLQAKSLQELRELIRKRREGG